MPFLNAREYKNRLYFRKKSPLVKFLRNEITIWPVTVCHEILDNYAVARLNFEEVPKYIFSIVYVMSWRKLSSWKIILMLSCGKISREAFNVTQHRKSSSGRIPFLLDRLGSQLRNHVTTHLLTSSRKSLNWR